MAVLTRLSNLELLKLPNCEGLTENGKCRWLDVNSCNGADCSFRKKNDFAKKIENRLNSLDEQTQEHIAKKYYNGKRPWLEQGYKESRNV